MKIYIGPYKNWIGPFQIAEKILFWMDKDKDERVHNFGEWLAHGSVEPEPEFKTGMDILSRKERPNTLLYRFLLWLESKRKRKVKIRIDRYDTWGMDSTLSMIILPMLKQLQETKHGAPYVEDEDVPEHLRSTVTEPRENEWDTDSNHFLRWDWVMDELIWTFTQLHPDTDWEEQYRSGEYDLHSVPCEWDEAGKPTLFQMKDGPNHTAKIDYDGMKAHQNRINNGLRLFGRYYQGLWD